VRRTSKPDRANSDAALPSNLSPRTSIEVAAGLVFREGKLLITQRPAAAHLGGLWEFPGGKREAGESYAQCVTRELLEELGIEIRVGEVLESLTHEYPGKTVHLEFFRCQWLRSEPQAIGCPAFRWITVDDLDAYEFPAADARLLKKLKQSPQLWL
jgi:8-oxo-dGTP diphosphatase